MNKTWDYQNLFVYIKMEANPFNKKRHITVNLLKGISKSLRQKRLLGLLKAKRREPYYEICWWQHHTAGRLVSELKHIWGGKPALHCQRPSIDTPFKQDRDHKHKGDNDTGTTSEQEPEQSPAGTHAEAPTYWKPVKLPGKRHSKMIPVWKSHSKSVEEAECSRYIDLSA